MSNRLTIWILIGMIAGAVAGTIIHHSVRPEVASAFITNDLSIGTDLFLRAIKMIVAPLVFFGLVSGIVTMGDPKAVGRMGLRALAWFLVASVVSLLIGIAASNILDLGAEINAATPSSQDSLGFTVSPFNLKAFLTGVIPQSITQAMAQNDILQIVVFAVAFGIATASVGGTAQRIVSEICDAIFRICLTLTSYVMWLAPIGVGTALCGVIAVRGVAILLSYGKLLAGFYAALVVLLALIVFAGRLVLGKDVYRLVALMRSPFLIGFATASSEAAFPLTIEQLERFGISRRISGFVLPLGYSFNLDGSMVYQAFAVIFVAQAFHVDMSFMQQLGVLLVMLVTSKGMAGVPRASLVVVAASLPAFGLPAAGLLLILGIDPFFDMGRTAVSVLGNGIAAAAIAKWEGDTCAEGTEDVAAPTRETAA